MKLFVGVAHIRIITADQKAPVKNPNIPVNIISLTIFILTPLGVRRLIP